MQNIKCPDCGNLNPDIRELGYTLPATCGHCLHMWRLQDVDPHSGCIVPPTPAAPAQQRTELDSPDFIRRTNEDYAAWCATFYRPDALDERGMQSLHGLWAWQEQERRKCAGITSPSVK